MPLHVAQSELPSERFGYGSSSVRAATKALMVDYLGERVPFARAVNAARRIALHEARGRMEQKSILGWDEEIFFGGMPTWRPNPACVGMDEDTREMLGYRFCLYASSHTDLAVGSVIR
jgi:hypothetical protein